MLKLEETVSFSVELGTVSCKRLPGLTRRALGDVLVLVKVTTSCSKDKGTGPLSRATVKVKIVGFLL